MVLQSFNNKYNLSIHVCNDGMMKNKITKDKSGLTHIQLRSGKKTMYH